MKGPFSIWAFFGLTLWIDILTHIFILKKEDKINPYAPLKQVSVIIPIHKEPKEYLEKTIIALFDEKYPIKNIVLCGDSESLFGLETVQMLSKNYNNLWYIESPYKSKAKKINYVAKNFKDVGEFLYVRDCRVVGKKDTIEKMMSYFNSDNVAAVTSYGRVSIPKNYFSRAYFYGKAWINEVGRFRKNAQEKRKAVFVICGASTIFRTEILRKIPMSSGTKTEDTHYTWILQKKGYKIRVADDAIVSAPEVDGEGMDGIKAQLKQAYRWSSGTIQCIYREGPELFKNKRLTWTTIAPGFIEAVMYAIPLFLLPLLFFIYPKYAIGFFIGDTVFSLLGTLIILPKKFIKTLIHYPEIIFFKYLNALVFVFALTAVTYQAAANKTSSWANEWIPPKTD